MPGGERLQAALVGQIIHAARQAEALVAEGCIIDLGIVTVNVLSLAQ